MELPFATPLEMAELTKQVRQLQAEIEEIKRRIDRPLTIAEACETTGLKRSALFAERKRAETGDSILKPVQHGRKQVLMHSTCVAFRQARELGTHRQPTR